LRPCGVGHIEGRVGEHDVGGWQRLAPGVVFPRRGAPQLQFGGHTVERQVHAGQAPGVGTAGFAARAHGDRPRRVGVPSCAGGGRLNQELAAPGVGVVSASRTVRASIAGEGQARHQADHGAGSEELPAAQRGTLLVLVEDQAEHVAAQA
jgi:hypothetical protein